MEARYITVLASAGLALALLMGVVVAQQGQPYRQIDAGVPPPEAKVENPAVRVESAPVTTRVEAPFAHVERDADGTRVRAPGVDIHVPRTSTE